MRFLSLAMVIASLCLPLELAHAMPAKKPAVKKPIAKKQLKRVTRKATISLASELAGRGKGPYAQIRRNRGGNIAGALGLLETAGMLEDAGIAQAPRALQDSFNRAQRAGDFAKLKPAKQPKGIKLSDMQFIVVQIPVLVSKDGKHLWDYNADEWFDVDLTAK